MLDIVPFVLGPVETNTYLVADPASGQAVVIDPAWEGERLADEARRRGWRIVALWITHAHFDHLAGVPGLWRTVEPRPQVLLHPADRPLWEMQGGAPWFGIPVEPLPSPTGALRPGMSLTLGDYTFEVRHAPGHTPGHVIFVCTQAGLAFVGDVIFRESIGRADLPGGDYATLIRSIREQVFTLPPTTRLLPGHGPETTVGHEQAFNPFLKG